MERTSAAMAVAPAASSKSAKIGVKTLADGMGISL
jgi:hypothetical protein